jgi:hypothetical protein
MGFVLRFWHPVATNNSVQFFMGCLDNMRVRGQQECCPTECSCSSIHPGNEQNTERSEQGKPP